MEFYVGTEPKLSQEIDICYKIVFPISHNDVVAEKIFINS